MSAIEKLTFLRQRSVDTWDLSQLSPNRSKQLAQLAKKSTSQALRRAPKERRYPILLAFLAQRLIETTDEVVDLYLRCLAETDARARRDLDEFRQTVARATNETLHLFQALGWILLDPKIVDEQVRTSIYQAIPKERLQTAVEVCERIVRPLDDNYFDFLASRYSYIVGITQRPAGREYLVGEQPALCGSGELPYPAGAVAGAATRSLPVDPGPGG